jgi:hypothetical protein
LPGSHAADPQTDGNFLFRGYGLAGLEGAGSDLLKQMLLNLIVKRDDAMSVECREVHRTLQLYGQLGF